MPSSLYPKALRFATKAHAGQKRTSGEPFVTHLIAVAELVESIGADEETLAASLLHDTLEDTHVTAAQLKKEFGPVIVNLVEGVTKVQQLEKSFDKRVRNMESVRKMFRTMGKDIRVLFIKLADRLHNMRTIGAVPVEKQVRIARETHDIYCPLAMLLGIRGWYEELTDICFSVLDPVEHDFMERKFEQTWKQQHRALEQWEARLTADLSRRDGKASIALKRRVLRDVRNNSINQEELLRCIEPFHAVHVIIPNSRNCYETLGAVHAFATPMPGGIDDYLATPKVNGYQAIHTNVLTSSGMPILVIIQTEEMRDQADLGMALLYKQPAKKWKGSVPDWLETVLTLDESERDLQSFFRRVQAEVFGERNHVQIVSGKTKKAVDLPSYASVLDLAFYVSDSVGVESVGATVNGRPASLKQTLGDGDTVELIRAGGQTPRTAEDLYCIHTALAHKHLITHLSSLPPRECLRRGETLLQNAVNITMDPFFGISWRREVESHIGKENDTLKKIGCGLIDAFLHAEEHGKPEEFFLLDPACFHFPSGMRMGSSTRFILKTTLEGLRAGDIVGVQVAPDVIEVMNPIDVKRARWQIFTREIVPLQIRPNRVDLPFHFALKWHYLPDVNPLKDIAAIESFLDTPVRLLQFGTNSVTLGFRTDCLRTIQIGYKYLYSLPHISQLFRVTPEQ